MNIKEFRIVEDALRGFYIQRRFTAMKRKYFLFWLIRIEIIDRWENITESGDRRYYYLHGFGIHSMTPFKTKQEAIDYLEKLCTPNKFYYPDNFNEGWFTVPLGKNDPIS